MIYLDTVCKDRFLFAVCATFLIKKILIGAKTAANRLTAVTTNSVPKSWLNPEFCALPAGKSKGTDRKSTRLNSSHLA